MKRSITALACLMILAAAVLAYAAAPKKAVCLVCKVHEGEDEPEKVAASTTYQGQDYHFCSEKCKKTFAEDPLAYIPPVLPRPAPAFTLKSLQGEEIASKSFQGKPVLVDFWATWCQPCITAMPRLEKLHSQLAGQGFSVVGVSIDEGEAGQKKARELVQKRKLGYPVYLDATQTPAWSAFHVRVIPAMFLIDGKGQVVRQWTGKVDLAEVEKAVRDLVGSAG